MKYTFYSMRGVEPLWTYEEPKAVGNDEETRMAIQKLFGNFPTPPPDDVVVKIGRTEESLEQWSVGPFDVLVRKEP